MKRSVNKHSAGRRVLTFVSALLFCVSVMIFPASAAVSSDRYGMGLSYGADNIIVATSEEIADYVSENSAPWTFALHDVSVSMDSVGQPYFCIRFFNCSDGIVYYIGLVKDMASGAEYLHIGRRDSLTGVTDFIAEQRLTSTDGTFDGLESIYFTYDVTRFYRRDGTEMLHYTCTVTAVFGWYEITETVSPGDNVTFVSQLRMMEFTGGPPGSDVSFVLQSDFDTPYNAYIPEDVLDGIRDSAYDAGYYEGYPIGYDRGYDVGYSDGDAQGIKDGILAGYADGKEFSLNQAREWITERGYATQAADLISVLDHIFKAGWTSAVDQGTLTQQLIYTALEAPFNIALGGLNFDVFGVNLASLMFGLLSMVIVLFILRAVIDVIL